MLKHWSKISLCIALFVATSFQLAAQIFTQEEQLQEARAAGQSQRVDLDQYIQSQQQAQSQAYLQGDVVPAMQDEDSLPVPYGANLFESGIETARQNSLNPNYLIAPGDKISVQLWGAVGFAEVLTVDNQGNLFIPEIGPIAVANLRAEDLNQVLTDSIKSVYPNNVNIYVNLLTSTPVGVFVTGPVIRPGQYAGSPSDSLLHYLKRAGGIDPDRGSYRAISVIRDGSEVARYDLYDFIREGRLETFTFRDKDVVLVDQQESVIVVEGEARNPFRFELTKGGSKGKDLVYYASPLAKTSHVAVTGNRTTGPISVYMAIEDFDNFDIKDGDTVLFNDDLRPQVLSVSVSGSYIGPSYYAVNTDTKLLDLLAYIEVDPEQADIGSVYIKRESVAARQAELLEESLQRLERSIFTAPASSDGESRIRAQEAELVAQFIARARRVEPIGKVIVSSDGNVANVRLEQGDEIVIPAKNDLVQVAGEVLMPQAVVFNGNAQISDYVAWAGGFTERANDERIAVIHANGLLSFVEPSFTSHWFSGNQNVVIQPGDQILVLPAVDTKVMQAIKDITQIIFQIAVAANIAIDIAED